ncbi:MAG: peptidase [Novosphingobium sp.]|nr:peptidase [Novosphingobium sp.]
MTFQRKHILGLGIAALIFILDQLIKWLMTGPLQLQAIRQIVILPFFNLTWTENYGVSLGLLTADSNAMRWGLVALTGAIAVFVAVWLLREKKLGDITALALVLGGALGNIVDRGTVGYVIDYADLHFGEWRPFLIFNLADAAITIGVLIILARSFLSREKPEPEQPQIDPANSASES